MRRPLRSDLRGKQRFVRNLEVLLKVLNLLADLGETCGRPSGDDVEPQIPGMTESWRYLYRT